MQECMETLTNTSLPDSKYCSTFVITCMIQYPYSVCLSMMLFQAEFKANLSLPVESPTHSTMQWVTTSTSCPTHMLTAHMLKLSLQPFVQHRHQRNIFRYILSKLAPRTKFVQCPVRSRRAALQHTPVLRLKSKFVQYRVRSRGAGLQYG